MKESTTLIIDFEPIGRRVEITPGVSLLEAAQSAGVELISICGGQGSCKCKMFTAMKAIMDVSCEHDIGFVSEKPNIKTPDPCESGPHQREVIRRYRPNERLPKISK